MQPWPQDTLLLDGIIGTFNGTQPPLTSFIVVVVAVVVVVVTIDWKMQNREFVNADAGLFITPSTVAVLLLLLLSLLLLVVSMLQLLL